MMESTISVSKGVFVFKNGIKAAQKKSRKKNKQAETILCDTMWYSTYKSLWEKIETRIQDLNNEMFSNVLNSLVHHINNCYKNEVTEIPTAVLLTGINMPDHGVQFGTLKHEINDCVTPHVAVLNGEDCQNLKYLVGTLVNQLMKSSDSDSDGEDTSSRRIAKSRCSFSFLQAWYYRIHPRKEKIIAVIIPEFENFSSKVLQDFILIASSYINVLPFVFIFGVATSLSTLHRLLPLQVSSKINIEIFHSSPSTTHLNNILENVLFSENCPFHLGGNVFNLLTDIFLFYDLSVSNFIKNFKYAMFEHFSYGNATAFCRRKKHKYVMQEFSHEDCENARHLMSFRKLVEKETPENQIKLLTNDDYFKNTFKMETKKIVVYLNHMHLFLKCLHVLVSDLPKTPLGSQVRQLYALAVSKRITVTPEYKECFQLLSFQSRNELINKLEKIYKILENNNKFAGEEIKFIIERIKDFVTQLYKLNSMTKEDVRNEKEREIANKKTDDWIQLKEKIKNLSIQTESSNGYEKLRKQILDFLSQQFELFLMEPKSYYFYEIFFFDDMSIQNHIIGTHRAVIHSALSDPHFYLQCSCCKTSNDFMILSSMPDISIAYKLHLECGKMINLYDWLQSFLSIVDPQEVEDEDKVKVRPELQARFTQAVAELEYIGFIKSSKRKTDHVARLTWGG